MADEQIKVAVLETEMKNLIEKVGDVVVKLDSLHDKIDNHYIKKEDFMPVKKAVEELKYWQAKVIGYALAVAFTLQYLPPVLKEIIKSLTTNK